MDDKLLIKPPSEEVKKLLMSRGVDPFDFVLSKAHQFDAHRAITRFEPDIARTTNNLVNTEKQRRQLAKVLAKPLHNYTMCICSFPTEKRAKALAAYIMGIAFEKFDNERPRGRTYPLWHKVFGSLGDPLRDKNSQGVSVPSLLILSNIAENSSNVKIEKVRDLLTKYNNIPRIVVVGGSDPHTFFAQKLYYPLNYGILLGSDNKVIEQ